MLDSCFGIPDTLLLPVDLVQQHTVVEPRNLCSNLLHKFFLGPTRCKRSHVLEISRREAFHLWEGFPEVHRQAVDYLRSPTLFSCRSRTSSRLTDSDARRRASDTRRFNAERSVWYELGSRAGSDFEGRLT